MTVSASRRGRAASAETSTSLPERVMVALGLASADKYGWGRSTRIKRSDPRLGEKKFMCHLAGKGCQMPSASFPEDGGPLRVLVGTSSLTGGWRRQSRLQRNPHAR